MSIFSPFFRNDFLLRGQGRSLCNDACYGRGSAVLKLQSSQDGLRKTHHRLEIYSFITVGIDIKKQYSRKELWDTTINFPFIKEGPVYPMLNEVWKEALKQLSLAIREFEQTLSWLPLRHFQVIHSVRKLPKLENKQKMKGRERQTIASAKKNHLLH